MLTMPNLQKTLRLSSVLLLTMLSSICLAKAAWQFDSKATQPPASMRIAPEYDVNVLLNIGPAVVCKALVKRLSSAEDIAIPKEDQVPAELMVHKPYQRAQAAAEDRVVAKIANGCSELIVSLTPVNPQDDETLVDASVKVGLVDVVASVCLADKYISQSEYDSSKKGFSESTANPHFRFDPIIMQEMMSEQLKGLPSSERHDFCAKTIDGALQVSMATAK